MKKLINYLLIISLIIFIGVFAWIVLTTHQSHTFTSYVNRRTVLGLSGGIMCILFIIRNQCVK